MFFCFKMVDASLNVAPCLIKLGNNFLASFKKTSLWPLPFLINPYCSVNVPFHSVCFNNSFISSNNSFIISVEYIIVYAPGFSL